MTVKDVLEAFASKEREEDGLFYARTKWGKCPLQVATGKALDYVEDAMDQGLAPLDCRLIMFWADTGRWRVKRFEDAI